jgi:hypothetical protein
MPYAGYVAIDMRSRFGWGVGSTGVSGSATGMGMGMGRSGLGYAPPGTGRMSTSEKWKIMHKATSEESSSSRSGWRRDVNVGARNGGGEGVRWKGEAEAEKRGERTRSMLRGILDRSMNDR